MSAGPWQGLDATASAERETISGSVAEPAAGVQGHSPRWRVRGFAEPGLGMGEVGFCWTNQSYKRSSGVIMDVSIYRSMGVITLHRQRKGLVVVGAPWRVRSTSL